MKEHYNDDTDNAVNGGHQKVTIRAGTTAAGSAPLKFASGSLMTVPEVGAVEFNTDTLYFTITTGAARKKIPLIDTGAPGATGDVYYRDASGNFARLGIGTTGQAIIASGGVPVWGSPGNTVFTTNTQTVSYTVGKSDTVIFADATSGNLTVTLPSAPSVPGYRFYIKRIDGSTNVVTLTCNGSGGIDGATNMTIGRQYTSVEVISNGNNWYIL